MGHTERADDRAQRIGFNEAVFREVNERVREVSDAFVDTADTPLPLACECGDATCVERFEMSRDEYEELRADASLFAVVPGHEAPDVEDVVARRGEYDVVRKRPGGPRDLAEATDPRET